MPTFKFETFDGPLFLDSDDASAVLNGQGGSIVGAQCYVETAGQMQKRVTATRVMLTGVFALAWQKRSDSRELYLLIDAPTFSLVARVEPNEGVNARRFAAALNTVARGGEVKELMLVVSKPDRAAAKRADDAAFDRSIHQMTPQERRAHARSTLIRLLVTAGVFLVVIIVAVVWIIAAHS